ncbi:hypothetical protein [Natronobeatus ordinarius]|uniref:hypothetical protein n=1 Tax=Natronobeatus ordinarius TaxID=2963433 RepID=UPI0020CE2211|nr:hypothetical protein [Natronobeatus ordinarius]
MEYLLALPVLNTILSLVLLGWWVTIDASDRGSKTPVFWGIAVIALAGIPAVLYLVYRKKIGPRRTSPGRKESAVGTVFVATLIGYVGVLVAPPDPVTAGLYLPVAFVVGLIFGYLLIWQGGVQFIQSTR